MSLTDQDRLDAMRQSYENWREAQLPGVPSLRQELAYRDGFADALRWLREHATATPNEDGRERASLCT
jgi:hypothetical protein